MCVHVQTNECMRCLLVAFDGDVFSLCIYFLSIFVFLEDRLINWHLSSVLIFFPIAFHHRTWSLSGWVKVKSQFQTFSKWLVKVLLLSSSSMKQIRYVVSVEKAMRVKRLDVSRQNFLCRCRQFFVWQGTLDFIEIFLFDLYYLRIFQNTEQLYPRIGAVGKGFDMQLWSPSQNMYNMANMCHDAKTYSQLP